MTSFCIRRAAIDDLACLIDIENTCFKSDKISRRQMHYALAQGKNILLVACDKENNRPVAYGYCLTPDRHKTARLYSLAVLPQYRGAHIASNLLNTILIGVEERSFQYCTLEVRMSDTKTQSLYRKFGFVPVKSLSHYYQDGEDALKFQLVLSKLPIRREI